MNYSGGNELNPYEAPLEVQPASARPVVFRRSRFASYLTRIVVLNGGVNIMGLLEFAAVFGVVAGTIGLASNLPRKPWGQIILSWMAFVPLGVAAFDIWWRSGQPEKTRWGRLFSPYAGGCWLFVPAWLALLAGIAVISTLLLINIGR